MSGAVSYYSGLAAEEQVAAHYMRSGCRIASQRWRGKYGGEIDLIERGVMPAGVLTPAKARLLLMLLVASGETGADLQRSFARYAES